MDFINKLHNSISTSVSQLSNVLPGNPLSREYEIENQVCSAGIGNFLKKRKLSKKISLHFVIAFNRIAMARVQGNQKVNETRGGDLRVPEKAARTIFQRGSRTDVGNPAERRRPIDKNSTPTRPDGATSAGRIKGFNRLRH